MNREIRHLGLVILAGLATCSSHAEVFRWVDKAGKVHYADSPDPANRYKNVSGLEAPPCDSECEQNVKQQQQYRQQYLQEKKSQTARKNAEKQQYESRVQQDRLARERQAQQEAQAARQRSDAEKKRTPSNSPRKP